MQPQRELPNTTPYRSSAHLGPQCHANNTGQLVHAGLHPLQRLAILIKVQLLCHRPRWLRCPPAAEPHYKPMEAGRHARPVQQHTLAGQHGIQLWKENTAAPAPAPAGLPLGCRCPACRAQCAPAVSSRNISVVQQTASGTFTAAPRSTKEHKRVLALFPEPAPAKAAELRHASQGPSPAQCSQPRVRQRTVAMTVTNCTGI